MGMIQRFPHCPIEKDSPRLAARCSLCRRRIHLAFGQAAADRLQVRRLRCSLLPGAAQLRAVRQHSRFSRASADNRHDGLMRVQMCGQPTGTCNVFEIKASDLDQALKLGFKKWIRD